MCFVRQSAGRIATVLSGLGEESHWHAVCSRLPPTLPPSPCCGTSISTSQFPVASKRPDRCREKEEENGGEKEREKKRVKRKNGKQNKTNDVPFKQAKLSTTVISNQQSLCRFRAVQQKVPRQETFCATVHVCVCLCECICGIRTAFELDFLFSSHDIPQENFLYSTRQQPSSRKLVTSRVLSVAVIIMVTDVLLRLKHRRHRARGSRRCATVNLS